MVCSRESIQDYFLFLQQHICNILKAQQWIILYCSNSLTWTCQQHAQWNWIQTFCLKSAATVQGGLEVFIQQSNLLGCRMDSTWFYKDNTPLIFSYLIFCLLVITGIKEEKEKNKRWNARKNSPKETTKNSLPSSKNNTCNEYRHLFINFLFIRCNLLPLIL